MASILQQATAINSGTWSTVQSVSPMSVSQHFSANTTIGSMLVCIVRWVYYGAPTTAVLSAPITTGVDWVLAGEHSGFGYITAPSSDDRSGYVAIYFAVNQPTSVLSSTSTSVSASVVPTGDQAIQMEIYEVAIAEGGYLDAVQVLSWSEDTEATIGTYNLTTTGTDVIFAAMCTINYGTFGPTTNGVGWIQGATLESQYILGEPAGSIYTAFNAEDYLWAAVAVAFSIGAAHAAPEGVSATGTVNNTATAAVTSTVYPAGVLSRCTLGTPTTIQPGPGKGSFEVRLSDDSWGCDTGGNLIGRYTTQKFSVPRLRRNQVIYVKEQDGRNNMLSSEIWVNGGTDNYQTGIWENTNTLTTYTDWTLTQYLNPEADLMLVNTKVLIPGDIISQTTASNIPLEPSSAFSATIDIQGNAGDWVTIGVLPELISAGINYPSSLTLTSGHKISAVSEASDSTVTLTVSGYFGGQEVTAARNQAVYLSGLTVATWLNGYTVTLLSGTTAGSLVFADPTSHGTQAPSVETGNAAYAWNQELGSAVTINGSIGDPVPSFQVNPGSGISFDVGFAAGYTFLFDVYFDNVSGGIEADIRFGNDYTGTSYMLVIQPHSGGLQRFSLSAGWGTESGGAAFGTPGSFNFVINTWYTISISLSEDGTTASWAVDGATQATAVLPYGPIAGTFVGLSEDYSGYGNYWLADNVRVEGTAEITTPIGTTNAYASYQLTGQWQRISVSTIASPSAEVLTDMALQFILTPGVGGVHGVPAGYVFPVDGITVYGTRGSIEEAAAETIYCKTMSNGTSSGLNGVFSNTLTPYGALSRYASSLKCGYPFIPQPPTGFIDFTDPGNPVVNLILPSVAQDVWGVEIRAGDNETVLYNSSLAASSYAPTYTVSGNIYRTLSFYLYTYNLLGEYSSSYYLTATVALPTAADLVFTASTLTLSWIGTAPNYKIDVDDTDSTFSNIVYTIPSQPTTSVVLPSSVLLNGCNFSNVSETSGSVVTLTVYEYTSFPNNSTVGMQVVLSGLTTATWLNGVTVTLITGTTSEYLVFNDPTLHGTQSSTAETGSSAPVTFFRVTPFDDVGSGTPVTTFYSGSVSGTVHSTGFVNPSVSGYGEVDWADPQYLPNPKGSIGHVSYIPTSVVTSDSGVNAGYVFGFPLTIPSDATILGVIVTFMGSGYNTHGAATPSAVNVYLTTTAGIPTGTPITKSVGVNSSNTVGSASDLFGVALTPSLVNGSGFGVAFNVTSAILVGTDTGGSGGTVVWNCSIEVWYSTP